MQSPIDREICRSHIMEIVLFLCFHSFTDGHSLSLSCSLSMQTPIDREICRSHITEIVPFPCFHCFTDGHSFSLSVETLILVFSCCHFATDCLYEDVQFMIYCLEAQPISAVSPNTCTLKLPVDSQHWKTNKVVWTWKDEWPPWRTSTYERPFTQEGNYLVNPFACIVSESTCDINTIRFKCIAKCINLQSFSDAMWFEHLVTLRCYAGERVNE